MNRTNEERRTRNVREHTRGGLSATMAAVGLAAIVVVVGVAGFFAMTAVDHGTTHTITSCAPAASPTCQSEKNDSHAAATDIVFAAGG